MDFETAKQMIIPKGRYKDQTIDMVAGTDEGLKYLDWLVGTNYWWLNRDGYHDGAPNNVKEALKVYLADQDIARDLGKLLEGQSGELHFEL